MLRKLFSYTIMAIFLTSSVFGGVMPAAAQTSQIPNSTPANPQDGRTMVADEIGGSTSTAVGQDVSNMRNTTTAMREAAASHKAPLTTGTSVTFAGINPATAYLSPLANVASAIGKVARSIASMASPQAQNADYFGVPNYANSPLPTVAANGTITGGMRKFVDGFAGFCGVSLPNDLGQCIPIAVPDKTTFAGSLGNPAADYYEIALVEYYEQLHANLPAAGTQLRGYVQLETSVVKGAHIALTYPNSSPILDATGAQVYAVSKPSYLGPTIIATRNRPVRVKFTNYLPYRNGGGAVGAASGGDLYIPTDTTYMGAGMGPGGSIKAINITASGAGYTATPTVVFSAPPAGGTAPVATANIMGGKVISFTITDGGTGYATAPTVTLNGGGFTTRARATSVLDGTPGEMYTQNRATLHLHGGNTPWISDGTPHQWTTPRGQLTSYSRGDSVSFVPDMWFNANGNLLTTGGCQQSTNCAVAGATNDPGPGSLSFYWTNQESGRLMFYHDHAYGITRLNVYAGEAAGYLLTDPNQENALAALGVPGTVGTVPDLAHLIPLVIQDKTFVPDPATQLAVEDPTWNTAAYGGLGNLWFPHVYTPNQNPYDISGANAFGRWDYGPWFWPPQNPSTLVSQPVTCTSVAYPAQNLTCPGIPNPSGTPEGFMDTPVINGTAYPTMTVDPTAYRFQMLMAGNDRTWNLGWYIADPLTIALTNGGSGYTIPPTVSFTSGGGSGAIASAVVSGGLVNGFIVTGVGAGYTAAPLVTISGDGSGATATAALDATGHLGTLTVTAGGTGYTFATVAIAAPTCAPLGTATCSTATANVTIAPSGTLIAINVLNPGTGWTSAPTVGISAPTGTGGTQAYAIASVNTEVKMVDAVPHTANSALKPCTATNTINGSNLITALFDASGNPLNNTGLAPNCWPASWPTDGRDGGVPDPTTAGPPMIQIGTEGGLLPNPVVIPSTPNGYEYNRRSITVLNDFYHGLLLGPAERADVVVDFSKFAGKTLILYNDAPTPVPAFDPRNDYYTNDPDNTFQGGAPTTLPGYGPNTRTIMQVKVNAAIGGAGGTGTSVASVALTNGGSGYTDPSVAIAAPGGTGTTATASISGSVSTLNLTSAGSGYTKPVVTIAVPTCTPGPNCVQAQAAMGSGVVNSLTLGAGGSGYSSAPSVTFTGGGGSLASATTSGSVNGLTWTAGGTGYASTAVTLAAPPAGGTQATATATGVVNAVAIQVAARATRPCQPSALPMRLVTPPEAVRLPLQPAASMP